MVAPEKGEIVLNWTCDPHDLTMMQKICKRVLEVYADRAPKMVPPDFLVLYTDLQCAHCNGTPMQLLGLLTASDDDLTHDVLGIGIHIDRKTGQLKNGFRPRWKRNLV